jgi:hypothetical protein
MYPSMMEQHAVTVPAPGFKLEWILPWISGRINVIMKWRVWSSGLYSHIVRIYTDDCGNVSPPTLALRLFHAGFLLGSSSDPEHRLDIFLWNIGRFPPHSTALYRGKKQCSSATCSEWRHPNILSYGICDNFFTGSAALLGRWPLLFSFLIIFLQRVGLLGRVISSSQCLYLNTGQYKHIINVYTYQTFMPWVGFDPTIPASEREKTVHALDRAATVTGRICDIGYIKLHNEEFQNLYFLANISVY